MRSQPSTRALLIAALLLGACSGKDVTGPGHVPSSTGTTITATVSAAGFRDVAYIWSLDADSPSDTVVVAQGGTAGVSFALEIGRSEASSIGGARGEVCVSNLGGYSTAGLAVAARVQRSVGGVFEDVLGSSESLQVAQQVAGGQSNCFPYEIVFDRDDDAEYRVVADVSIANHGVSSPAPGAVSAAGTVGSLAETSVDAGAELSADVACPAGYDCLAAASSWNLEGAATLAFEITVVNNAGACGEAVVLGSSANLVEALSATTYNVEASAVMMGGPCACTQRAGHWKDNSGANGNPDLISEHLPIWLGATNGAASVEVTSAAQAEAILTATGSVNAIPKLQRHLLAAKLNIATGTPDASVATLIADADAFLAQYGPSDWSSLSQTEQDQVEALKDALDDYNSGITGPGACS